jgi:hypothetical protein
MTAVKPIIAQKVTLGGFSAPPLALLGAIN